MKQHAVIRDQDDARAPGDFAENGAIGFAPAPALHQQAYGENGKRKKQLLENEKLDRPGEDHDFLLGLTIERI
jgi:hypothetical protein